MGVFDSFLKGFREYGANEEQINTAKTYLQGLKKMGMTDDQIIKIGEEAVRRRKEMSPPRVAFVGLVGVGKSSTLNALFNAGQPTSEVVACTKKEAEINGEYSTYKGSKGKIIVYDMPGLGESKETEDVHIETYKKVLPKVNVIVWTIAATDRKLKPEQDALEKLYGIFGKEFLNKLLIVINKIDSIDPGETYWNTKLNMPSLKQQENIKIKIKDVTEKIKSVLPEWNGNIVAYSARYGYRLEELMASIVEITAPEQRYNIGALADVMPQTSLMDPAYREIVEKMIKEGN